jgi:hypothetical protein
MLLALTRPSDFRFVSATDPFQGNQGNGVVFAGGTWVAVADAGAATIATAADAPVLSFAPVAGSNGLFSQANGVCARGSMFHVTGQGARPVAFSSTPAVLTSWTGVAGGVFSIAQGCAWSPSLLVVVGTGANWGAWSIDGTSFTGFGNGNPFVTAQAVAFGAASGWVAVGVGIVKVAVSVDGTIWTPIGDPASFATAGFAVAFGGNGRWVIGGNAGANTLASATLLPGAWNNLGSTVFSGVVQGIAWSDALGLFVATGAFLVGLRKKFQVFCSKDERGRQLRGQLMGSRSLLRRARQQFSTALRWAKDRDRLWLRRHLLQRQLQLRRLPLVRRWLLVRQRQ